MAEILFLSQRIPFPPNKGDKIRSWHILRHLAERHRVHLGCFYDDPADEEHVAVLRGLIGGELLCLFLNKRWAAFRGAAAFLAGRSVTEGYFHSGRMRRWIAS